MNLLANDLLSILRRHPSVASVYVAMTKCNKHREVQWKLQNANAWSRKGGA